MYSLNSGDSFDPTQWNDLQGGAREEFISELRALFESAPHGGTFFLEVLTEMGDPWIEGKARLAFVGFVRHRTSKAGGFGDQANAKRTAWIFLAHANKELPEREDWSHIEEVLAIKDLRISRLIEDLLKIWVFQDDYGKKVQLILDITTADHFDDGWVRSKTLDFLRDLGAPLSPVFPLKDSSPEIMAELRAFLMDNPFHIAENHPAIAG